MSIRERLLNILPIFILLCVLAVLFGCSINVSINPTTKTVSETTTEEVVDQERIPGQVNEEGTAQVIPEFEVTAESHENFKNFINKFNSNIKPSDVWNVEHFYGIKEGVVACIAFAETSMGTRGYGLCNNVGNVGNNDRGNRHCYATVQGGLEAIGQTLNNGNLGAKQTIGCLSKAGHCTEPNDNGKIRASSPSSRENNVVNCLEAIYQQEIDPSTFTFRK